MPGSFFRVGVLIGLTIVALVFQADLGPERTLRVEGLLTVRSSFGHSETLSRFEAAIRANGMSVVACDDHAGGALEISVAVGETTLLMYGNRARHAELVRVLRLIALELPFKVLIWHVAGQTYLSYTDFRWLATRYGVPRDDAYVFTDTAVMIDGIVRKAGSPP
jgi:uncharacterized protein (DUF302 family)